MHPWPPQLPDVGLQQVSDISHSLQQASDVCHSLQQPPDITLGLQQPPDVGLQQVSEISHSLQHTVHWNGGYGKKSLQKQLRYFPLALVSHAPRAYLPQEIFRIKRLLN